MTGPLPLILGAVVVVVVIAASVVAYGIHKGYKISAEPKATASALAQQAAPANGEPS